MNIKKILKGYTGFFLALLIAGLALIGWGAASESVFLGSLGGAVFGTSVSALINSIRNDDFLSEAIKIIRGSLISEFRSNEENINYYKRKFHRYHVSEAGGKFIWQYDVIDFQNSVGIGQLSTMVKIRDQNGKDHLYNSIAGIRDDRFVMFQKALVGSELTSVAIFPDLGKSFKDTHCGIMFKETWDKAPLMAPCIISTKPINKWIKPGRVSEAVSKELDKNWKTGFERFDRKIRELIGNPG